MEEVLFILGIAFLVCRLAGFPVWGRAIDHIKASRPPSFPEGANPPTAALILACRGAHPGLAETATIHLTQDYPCYDVIFSMESEADPAFALLDELRRSLQGIRARSVRFAFGGVSRHRAQKLDNQLAALRELADDVEALVFLDDDGRPGRDVMTRLLAPLEDPSVGVTTGWPWLANPQGLFTRMAALWFVGLLSGTAWKRVANGVAMATRRDTFEEAKVARRWDAAMTDDLTLALAVRDAGKSVLLVPQALVAQNARHGPVSLWRWIVRQIGLVRTYEPGIWCFSFVTYALPSLASWLGLIWLGLAGTGSTAAWLLTAQIPLSLLDTFGGLAIVRSAFLRCGADPEIARGISPAQAIWMPLVTLMIFPVYLWTAFVRAIRWGDFIYTPISDTVVRVRSVATRDATRVPLPAGVPEPRS